MTALSPTRGAEEGEHGSRRGWPLAHSRLPARNSEGRLTVAAVPCLELPGGGEVVADGAVRAGGALCRPVSAPARMSQSIWA